MQTRFRLNLVKHKSMLKHRIHATLMTFGHPCPVTDLFGLEGRKLLEGLEFPQPWRETLDASLYLIDYLESEIDAIERELRSSGADHRYVPLLLTVPGIGWVLAFTIASEIGDVGRFPSAKKLVGYTGLCPRVRQSGDSDRRGPLSKQGPKYLRWAMLEATMHALRHPAYRDRYQRTKQRLGKQRGAKSRPGRPRPQAHRGDLAHAHHQPAFRPRRCGRRHVSSSRPTALLELRPPPPASDAAWSSTRRRYRDERRFANPLHQANPPEVIHPQPFRQPSMTGGRHPHADTTPPASTRNRKGANHKRT